VSAFFGLHRARALLGATAILFVLALPALAGAVPARDHTIVTTSNAPSAIAASHAPEQYHASSGRPAALHRPVGATVASPSGPSWLGFGLAAGGALLLGLLAGGASTVLVRRRAPGFAG
jgi:hypothetical protein